MGRPIIDRKGKPYGSLTAIRLFSRNPTVWECLCVCGRTHYVVAGNLASGGTRSCGCAPKSNSNPLRFDPTYISWEKMHSRCRNSHLKTYKFYRGVTVCGRWASFDNFLEDMGHKPSPTHSIDRYPNREGNYEPGNCRWADKSEQARNTKRNILWTWRGETKCLLEWCQIFRLNYKTISNRVHLGWSLEDAILKPINKQKRNKNAH